MARRHIPVIFLIKIFSAWRDPAAMSNISVISMSFYSGEYSGDIGGPCGVHYCLSPAPAYAIYIYGGGGMSYSGDN